MSVNVSNLEIKLIQKINSAETELEVLTYQKVLETLRTGSVDVVSTFADLPDSNGNGGRIYFVEDENILYHATDLSGWRMMGTQAVSGQLWGWGFNLFEGEVGDGTTIDRSSPVREVSSSTDWCMVSGGDTQTSAIKSSGTLWSWGGGFTGALGNSSTVSSSSPVQEISYSNNWCQVSNGYLTAAIKTSGQLWAWGSNLAGEIGDNTTISKSSPVQEISSSTDWCMVSSGKFNTSAIKTSGTLWAWGCNDDGQLGSNTTTNSSSPVQEITSSINWCQVSASRRNAFGIKTSGQLWAWGRNNCGGAGDQSGINRSSPVQEISSSTDWNLVASGISHASAIKTSGTLWSWGLNDKGQLGDNTLTAASSPVQEISSSTDWNLVSGKADQTSALKKSGQIWGWGENGSGQLGDNTQTSRSSPVQEISSATDWNSVSNACETTFGIKNV